MSPPDRARRPGAAVLLLALAAAVSAPLLHSARAEPPPGAPPDEEIVVGLRTSLYSEVLGEWRPLEIYTPRSFDRSRLDYPVLVVLDGDWFFRYCVSIFEMMSPNHLPEMVVVGIPNVDRARDLDPADERGGAPGRGAARFRRFLRDELFPFLESEYRALPYRVLAGHSLAATSAVQCAFAEPDLFRAYIATSPALTGEARWGAVAGAVAGADSTATAGRLLYCSMGADEGAVRVATLDSLYKLIESRTNLGMRCSRDIFFGEGHVPIKGFYRGIRLLFENWFPRKAFVDGDLPALRRHYDGLTERFGFPVQPPFDILNSMAEHRMRAGETERAIEIYRYLISVYPETAWGYAVMGNALAASGDTTGACASFGEAWRLAPGDSEIESLAGRAGCRRPAE